MTAWHPNNLEADLDLLRAELDACVAEIARLRVALAGWDHFHDEAFPNDPYLLGRMRAEVERLRETAP